MVNLKTSCNFAAAEITLVCMYGQNENFLTLSLVSSQGASRFGLSEEMNHLWCHLMLSAPLFYFSRI